MNFNKIVTAGLAFTAMCILAPVSGHAAVFSGNPSTDGWTNFGVSNAVGDQYVRGSGNINFNVYSTALTVTNELLAECGSKCGTWAIGDQVLGLGLVYNSGNQAVPSFVLKWGTVGTPFILSGVAAPGNGAGSYSTVAGLGSVLGRLNTQAASGIYDPSEELDGAPPALVNIAYQKDAPGVNGQRLPDGFIVFNVIMSSGALISGEGLLNITRLNNSNPNGLGAYVFGGNSIVTLQRDQSTTGFTDALVTSFDANANQVPEPSTGLLAAGALAAAWAMKRRKQ